jgi:DNA repair protein RecO (recombination protein O)
MSTEKTVAVVIRMADFSESSRVLTLFTRDFGKVSAIAKGAKRLKGPFEAALDLLTVCNIVFIRKSSSGLDILTEAQLVKRFKPNGKDLGPLYAGYYVAELLAGLTEEYDPHPLLFDEAVQTLERLLEGFSLWLSVLRFELVFLREIGQLPMLDGCAVCGASPAAQGSYAFDVSRGGLICAECALHERPASRVQAGTLAVLRRLLSDAESTWKRVVISPQQLRELRSVLVPTLSQALGRRPKMLDYLKLSS